ncbi:acyltransferase [Aeromonas jandaei]|uniref:acyltransferase n=1 Tax=Aeromonas jandaei TaxID=650 RepID=UPI001ADDBA72|nr:acyltransferase [Aeromonas jandaei]
MSSIKKVYSIITNIIYLYIMNRLTKNVLKFSFPKIESGLDINLYHNAKLDLGNISARKNLNIFVSNGTLLFGTGCFINNNCSFNCLEGIFIGDNTIFGEGVKVYDHDHLIDCEYNVSKDKFVTSSIHIGGGCWIGSNTIILKGVTIVDNVIVGANSIVNKSIVTPGVYVNKNGSLVKIR